MKEKIKMMNNNCFVENEIMSPKYENCMNEENSI